MATINSTTFETNHNVPTITDWVMVPIGGGLADEKKALLIKNETNQTQGCTGQRLAVVNWRSVLTIIVVIIDYFLVYASISLIGAFFPTKVIYSVLSRQVYYPDSVWRGVVRSTFVNGSLQCLVSV